MFINPQEAKIGDIEVLGYRLRASKKTPIESFRKEFSFEQNPSSPLVPSFNRNEIEYWWSSSFQGKGSFCCVCMKMVEISFIQVYLFRVPCKNYNRFLVVELSGIVPKWKLFLGFPKSKFWFIFVKNSNKKCDFFNSRSSTSICPEIAL